MIEIKGISKTFGRKCLFDNISATINDGESVAIIGRSGIGKSVLLKHMSGLIFPDSGIINIDNKEINKQTFKQLQDIRTKIGVVFQFGALLDSLTVAGNINLALRKLTNLTNNEINDRIDYVLDEVGMLESKHLKPNELSGGMIKRVSIARAIAGKPHYLLYDEPTTGLDPLMVETINQLMKKIHDDGNITSIIVTHELKTIFDVSNRVLMLDDAKIIYDGSPHRMKDSSVELVKNFVSSAYINRGIDI
tara:strand:+ start:558 stop:1304 length:747 start_codon:yes stop_codon:yes gene_type:complete